MAVRPSDAFRAGARDAVPLWFAALPFGLVYGVAVAESTVSPAVGLAGSWLILAGAAQLTLLELVDADATWLVAVGTALVINARFALYSAAVAPAFAGFPRRWRFALAYLLTDQAASLGLVYFRGEPDPVSRRWWFLGAASFFASGWWIGSVVGVVTGSALPDWLDIGFAVPAMFIAILVPAIVDRPALHAALAAGVVAVLASPLPNGSNVVLAGCVGIAVGRLTTPEATR